MGLEIEKKYRVGARRAERLRRRLLEVGAEARGREFEENTIYGGPNLEAGSRLLRLRRAGGRAVLTYKEQLPSDSAVKRRREDETQVSDAAATASILNALGYRPALVYEKWRETWRVPGAEVVIDELPFGMFVEIEGEPEMIEEAEQKLGLAEAEAEQASYPQLTIRHGTRVEGGAVEARFAGDAGDG